MASAGLGAAMAEAEVPVGTEAGGVVEAIGVTDGASEGFGACGFGVTGGVPGGAAFWGAGLTGLGADTPAISDPSPSFCRLSASSFPVASKP